MTTTVQVANFFGPIALSTNVMTIYTVPATPNTNAFARGRMRFANTSNGSVNVTAYGVPSGGEAAVGNCFAFEIAVAANSYLDSDIPVLGPGMFIQALASGAGITVSMIDGMLFS